MVPIATPVRSTPSKKSGCDDAIATMATSNGTRGNERSGAVRPTIAAYPTSSEPPTMRTKPTLRGEIPSGPNAWAVPVVPHSVAAANTRNGPRRNIGGCYDRVDHHWLMERLARSALRWDAGYCGLLGAATVVFVSPIARVIDVSRLIVIITGIGAALWGGFVWIVARIPSWRTGTAVVVIANVAATALILFVMVVVDGPTARSVVLGGVGIQVFAFAAVQAHALWSPFGR